MALRRYRIGLIATLLGIAFVLFAGLPFKAHAATLDQLNQQYQIAVGWYESVLADQSNNAGEIAALDAEIGEKEQSLQQTREQLDETVVSLYKSTRGQGGLVELLLGSSSFYEAAMRFDTYQRVQLHYRDEIHRLSAVQGDLTSQRAALEERKRAIESEVVEAKEAVDDAEDAMRNATHGDGANYQQTQGNSENCGATAFAVAVNILLHEEKFPDNVKVWEGPGFEKDSTNNLAGRAKTWLQENKLSDKISVEEVKGDIHKPEELRAQLEQGNVVVISSGGESVWQRAEGDAVGPEKFAAGHWIVFYHYENGVFFANDSAVGKAQGAGVPYNEEQMKQWLDGRSTHFATVVSLR